MPPVSREQRLVDFVRNQDKRPTRSAAAQHLTEWMTIDQAQATIERAINVSGAVRAVQGGRLIYWDAEQGPGSSLYSTVARIITRRWGANELGLRSVEVSRPPHGRTSSLGTWTRPDLVVAAFPRRRRTADAPKDIHALEVERESGFDIRSVYQAYEQGRGAHYAWVFANGSEVDPRVETAARELGVGIVVFSNPNSVATYHTVVKAELRAGPDVDEFMARCFPKGTSELNDWEPAS